MSSSTVPRKRGGVYPNNKRPRDKGRRQQPPPPPKPTCAECDTSEPPKYKCPKCRVPYCSIACCRAHKEKQCVAVADVEPTKKKSKYLPSDLLARDPIQNAAQQRQILDDDDDLDDDMKITKSMMSAMDKSDWLQSELQDGGLRQLIHQVVTASNNVTRSGTMTHQEELLNTLQTKYPNFHVFVDKLKVMTGVLERQAGEGEEEDLEDWLKYVNRVDDLGPLALKGLPSRRALAPPTEEEVAASSSAEDESSSSDDGSESSSSSESH